MAADRFEVADYLAKVAAAKPAINVGTFIGHGSVRGAVVGQANRPATADELQRMRDLVRTGMREGAFGLSTGLFYVPGNYAPLEEVIELARVAGEFGGIHQSHMRDETVARARQRPRHDCHRRAGADCRRR